MNMLYHESVPLLSLCLKMLNGLNTRLATHDMELSCLAVTLSGTLPLLLSTVVPFVSRSSAHRVNKKDNVVYCAK